MRATHRPLTVVALLLAVVMSAIEATVVATAMPTVIADLGGVALYGWVGSAYLLASTVTVPLFGKLADQLGRKPVLVAGIVVFLIGSCACGMAGSIGILIAARAVQGLGAGAMQPVALTVVGDLFGVEERGKIQGYFGAVWGVSGIAGPLVGGLLVKAISWRAVFWINVPFGVLSVPVLLWALREPRDGKTRTSIDWAGMLTLAAAAVALLLGAGGLTALVAVGVALAVVFVLIERRAANPVLTLELVGRRPIAVGSIASSLLGAAMMGSILFVPLYVQGVLRGTPTEAGAAVAPMLVGWPIAATVTGKLMARIGFRLPVWLGSVLAAVGLVAFAVVLRGANGANGTWPLQIAMFVFGVGMGFANTALLVAVQSSVGFSQRGVATATTLFARSMGGALGVGALGALLAHRLEGAVAPEVVSALLESHGRAAVAPDPTVTAALAGALTPIFVVNAALACLNLAVVAFWPSQVNAPGAALKREEAA